MSKLVELVIASSLLTIVTGCSREPDVPNPPKTQTFATDASLPSSDASFWPCFHGPKGDNISTDTGLLKKWPDDGPTLVWATEGIGDGFSGVVLAHGMIYTDGNIGDQTTITAMDLGGNVLWQEPNGPAWTQSHPGSRGTPTIDGDRLYHESPTGNLICLDAKKGDKIWSLNILDEFDAKNIGWGLAESVLVDGDRVICCPGGKKAAVVALDKTSGKPIWTTPGTGNAAAHATAALAECEGLRVILAMTAKSLIGVRADTGELLFQHEHITKHDVNATTPVYHDGHIFITSGYGTGSEMLKLTVQGDKASVERVWKCKELDNHHGGVVLLDGYIYGCSARGRWMCLDWKSGEIKYSDKGVGKGSLTVADGMLYTLSERNKMGLVRATPDAHVVVSRFDVPSGGSAESWAHPVVCGGRMYLRHSDKLYAYDVKAEDKEIVTK
ncbi:MAG: PQQ-binding-like beta-propeller repeat protein [Candidatus Nealsonbacteria bacterium]|nr:PQQ-binding-like beta-propeller repeat protein [Candidatus Nealsonbacteria bacterium]